MIAQVKITVEVDPALARGMSAPLRARLARGLRASTCYRGVRIDGLPKQSLLGATVYASATEAVLGLHDYADALRRLAEQSGGDRTATGQWLLDYATFYLLAAQEIYARRRQLWAA